MTTLVSTLNTRVLEVCNRVFTQSYQWGTPPDVNLNPSGAVDKILQVPMTTWDDAQEWIGRLSSRAPIGLLGVPRFQITDPGAASGRVVHADATYLLVCISDSQRGYERTDTTEESALSLPQNRIPYFERCNDRFLRGIGYRVFTDQDQVLIQGNVDTNTRGWSVDSLHARFASQFDTETLAVWYGEFVAKVRSSCGGFDWQS